MALTPHILHFTRVLHNVNISHSSVNMKEGINGIEKYGYLYKLIVFNLKATLIVFWKRNSVIFQKLITL